MIVALNVNCHKKRNDVSIKLKKIINEEINIINEGIYETIGIIPIKKIKLENPGSSTQSVVYVDFDNVKDFINGKDTVGTSVDGNIEVWVNIKDYKQFTIVKEI